MGRHGSAYRLYHAPAMVTGGSPERPARAGSHLVHLVFHVSIGSW